MHARVRMDPARAGVRAYIKGTHPATGLDHCVTPRAAAACVLADFVFVCSAPMLDS